MSQKLALIVLLTMLGFGSAFFFRHRSLDESRIVIPDVTQRDLASDRQQSADTLQEQSITRIPIAGPLANRDAEVSGLAWYKDYLILLPQYPQSIGEEDGGNLFALPKADLVALLDGRLSGPLLPVPIAFKGPDFGESIAGFEGFEAIAFSGNQAFLTIEAETDEAVMGYLVTGTLAEDLSELTITEALPAEIPAQSASENKADESVLVTDDQVISLYEVNGVALNPQPKATVFDYALLPQVPLPFPAVEYRITDATALNESGRFWALNYFYKGDQDLLPKQDPLAETYGQGATHREQETVERLLEFAYKPEGITLTDTPPIQLALGPKGRNWEGLARLDNQGFLLVTDKFPETILAFVANPEL
ncbi:MAG: hypothetical protein AAF171_13250 [Cyanobacteria bacterium P01_A01_bin.116]